MLFVVIRLLRRILREPTLRRLFLTLIAFVALSLTSAVLFYLAEAVYGPQKSLAFSSCIYWAIVTMATVGYGDIVPKTFLGKVVSIATIVVGIAMFSLFISTLADIFMQGSLKKIMGLGKVKSADIVVVGANEVCREAINELKRNIPKAKITWVMEKRPRVPPDDVEFVVGDPTDEETLKRAGIESARNLILCVLDDSTAIHIVLTARKLNKSLKIASLAKSSRAAELLKEAGASIVVPFRRLGRELASAIFEPDVVHFLEEVTTAEGKADLVELEISSSQAGKSVKEIVEELQSMDRESRYVPVMITKDSGVKIFAPTDNLKLRSGDKLVLVKAKPSKEESETEYSATQGQR